MTRRTRLLPLALLVGALAASGLAVRSTVASADPTPPTTTTTTTTTTLATPTTTTTTTTPAPTPAGGVPSAPRCTPSVVARVRQLVGTELSDRVTQLDTLTTRVNAAATLTAADRATLLGDLGQTELPGIRALQTSVESDATCLELRRDAHAMVYDYRVYLVMTPQTDLVVANDAAVHAGGDLADLEPVVSAAIERARSHGTDVTGAQTAMADYQTTVTAAQDLTSGQTTTLLAQTPADYPASHAVFVQARRNVTGAVSDLHAARADLARIIQGVG
ncbi:MAG TPA: hypothetical protein VN796_09130 [Acidimicrobiales bacterium]|nr:hypothetical protein [Acidimicrobiales bacterium]